MRIAASILAVLACLACWAPTAHAGEEVEGRGWEIELPAGFTEAMSMEGGGDFSISAHFGTLPIESVPEIKAYVAGSREGPTAVLVISRVDLVTPVRTTEEMGLDRLSDARSQLPDGARIEATSVGEWNAIELTFRTELEWDSTTMRMLVVAVGDYCVAVMLMTKDEVHPNAEAMWSELRGSLDIDPPVNKWLLFGIVGIGALGAMWFLGRFGSRQVREIPEHDGRWMRREEGEIGTIATHKPMQTGVRPKVLPSSPPAFDPEQPDVLPAERRRLSPPTPLPEATAAAVTRPPAKGPEARGGLRATRPTSGRWGE